MVRARLVGSVLVLASLLAGPGWRAAGGADEVEAELVGFLIQLPGDGLPLPPAAPTMAAIEVPNEQGGRRQTIPVEFGPRTEIALRASHLRDGDLVVLEGVLGMDRVRVRQVSDADIAEFRGRVSLSRGPVSLPLATDQLIDVFLDGSPTVPVTFLLTPRTTTPRTSLRDGQIVNLAVVFGRRIVVDLEIAGGGR